MGFGEKEGKEGGDEWKALKRGISKRMPNKKLISVNKYIIVVSVEAVSIIILLNCNMKCLLFFFSFYHKPSLSLLLF